MAAIVKSSGTLRLNITHGEEAQLMLIHHVCGAAIREAPKVGTRVPLKRSSLLRSSRAAACPIQTADLSPRGSSTGEPALAPQAAAPGLCCCKESKCHGHSSLPAY